MNTSSLPTDLQIKISSLQDALLSAHPTMPVLLQQIHKQLKADPDNVTLLSEEDIGILVSGLKRQTATEISAAASKAKKPSLSKTSLDML